MMTQLSFEFFSDKPEASSPVLAMALSTFPVCAHTNDHFLGLRGRSVGVKGQVRSALLCAGIICFPKHSIQHLNTSGDNFN